MIFGSAKPREINYRQVFDRLRESGKESYSHPSDESAKKPVSPVSQGAVAVAEQVQPKDATVAKGESAGTTTVQSRKHSPETGNGAGGGPRDFNAPMGAVRSNIEAIAAGIAEEVRRTLRDEMNSLHFAQNSLEAKLAKMEEQVSRSEEACRRISAELERVRNAMEDLWRQPDEQQELILACRDWITEAARTLDERLNHHAEAIRSLHSAARGRDQWLETLQGALKQVGTAPEPLPSSMEAL